MPGSDVEAVVPLPAIAGLSWSIESQSGGNEGVGFAVPIKTAAEVVSQLESGGEVAAAQLQRCRQPAGACGAEAGEFRKLRGRAFESVIK